MAVERWTDAMLDELASSITELRESIIELRVSITELRESSQAQRDSIIELRESSQAQRERMETIQDSIDGMRITAQALLQVAAQSQQDMELIKQRQAEADERFNVLLEEVRYLNRRQNKSENDEFQ